MEDHYRPVAFQASGVLKIFRTSSVFVTPILFIVIKSCGIRILMTHPDKQTRASVCLWHMFLLSNDVASYDLRIEVGLSEVVITLISVACRTGSQPEVVWLRAVSGLKFLSKVVV